MLKKIVTWFRVYLRQVVLVAGVLLLVHGVTGIDSRSTSRFGGGPARYYYEHVTRAEIALGAGLLVTGLLMTRKRDK